MKRLTVVLAVLTLSSVAFAQATRVPSRSAIRTVTPGAQGATSAQIAQAVDEIRAIVQEIAGLLDELLALRTPALARVTRAPLLRAGPPLQAIRPPLGAQAPAISSPEAVQGLFVTPTAELKQEATKGLTRPQQAQVNRIIGLLKGGQQTAAMQEWQAFVGELRGVMGSSGGGNVMAMIYYVMRQSIIEQNEDKRYWLQKMQEHNKIAEALSDYLKELNRGLGIDPKGDDDEEGAPGRKRAGMLTVRAPVVTRAGDAPPKLSYRTKRLTSQNQVRTEIVSCEKQMQEMSDLTSQLQLQLQQAMNRQQQPYQMLSNIMKSMHDTAKAIIQNMR